MVKVFTLLSQQYLFIPNNDNEDIKDNVKDSPLKHYRVEDYSRLSLETSVDWIEMLSINPRQSILIIIIIINMITI